MLTRWPPSHQVWTENYIFAIRELSHFESKSLHVNSTFVSHGVSSSVWGLVILSITFVFYVLFIFLFVMSHLKIKVFIISLILKTCIWYISTSHYVLNLATKLACCLGKVSESTFFHNMRGLSRSSHCDTRTRKPVIQSV